MSERSALGAAQDRMRSDKEAERARSLRAARTAALARRGAGAVEAARRAYLVCACGGDRYGIALEATAEVLPMRPCTPVPGAVPALVGLAAISGRIVRVLDLARALNRQSPGRRDPAGGHLVVLRAGADSPVALAVDRVVGVAEGALQGDAWESGASQPGTADPSSTGMGDAAVSGYAADPDTAGDGGFVVLDLARLLRRALP